MLPARPVRASPQAGPRLGPEQIQRLRQEGPRGLASMDWTVSAPIRTPGSTGLSLTVQCPAVNRRRTWVGIVSLRWDFRFRNTGVRSSPHLRFDRARCISPGGFDSSVALPSGPQAPMCASRPRRKMIPVERHRARNERRHSPEGPACGQAGPGHRRVERHRRRDRACLRRRGRARRRACPDSRQGGAAGRADPRRGRQRRSRWPADLADRSGIEPMCAAALEGLDGIDVVVNNAGVFERNRILDVALEHWDLNFAVHVTAPLLITRPHRSRHDGAGRWLFHLHRLDRFARGGRGLGGVHRLQARGGRVDEDGGGGLRRPRDPAPTRSHPDGSTRRWRGATSSGWRRRAARTSMLSTARESASGMLRTRITPESVADTAVFLASDRARHVTASDPVRVRRHRDGLSRGAPAPAPVRGSASTHRPVKPRSTSTPCRQSPPTLRSTVPPLDSAGFPAGRASNCG